MKALILMIALALGAPASAAPQLEVLPGSHRIVVSYEPGLESTAREIQRSADATLARISEDLVDLPAPPSWDGVHVIRIQLVRDAASLAAIAPAGRGAPPWAIGIAYPDLGVIGIAMRRGAQVVDPISTMRHELAHLALGAALGARAPHWLHEGFAYQHSGEWSWDRSETLAGMAWFNGIVPLDDLDHSFPAEESPANRAYAESYDFVGYLSRRGRYEDAANAGDRWPFRRFLTAIGHGETLDAAAIRAYGRPLHALFDEWREQLSNRYLMAPVGLLGLAVWILCAILLGLAWSRRRRQNRRRIAQWERDDHARDDAMRLRPIIVPPYVPWPGEDPFADEDDDPPQGDPKLVN